jgi:hypothetical protein
MKDVSTAVALAGETAVFRDFVTYSPLFATSITLVTLPSSGG